VTAQNAPQSATRSTEVRDASGRVFAVIFDNPANPKVRVSVIGPRGGIMASFALLREDMFLLGQAMS
jgi:hypothetical protein